MPAQMLISFLTLADILPLLPCHKHDEVGFCIFFFTLCFEIISNLQKSSKDTTEKPIKRFFI